jgi:hypothetical protein
VVPGKHGIHDPDKSTYLSLQAVATVSEEQVLTLS